MKNKILLLSIVSFLMGCSSAKLSSSVYPDAVKLSYTSKNKIHSINQNGRPYGITPAFYDKEGKRLHPKEEYGFGYNSADYIEHPVKSAAGSISIAINDLNVEIYSILKVQPEIVSASDSFVLKWSITGGTFPLSCKIYHPGSSIQEVSCKGDSLDKKYQAVSSEGLDSAKKQATNNNQLIKDGVELPRLMSPDAQPKSPDNTRPK